MPHKDITGQTFGTWTALKYVGNDKNRNAVWKCVNGSGEKRNIPASYLRQYLRSANKKRRVRPNPDRIIDRTGLKYNKLTVLNFAGRHPTTKEYQWECLCDCGNTTIVVGGALQSGGIRSCGCLKRKKIL